MKSNIVECNCSQGDHDTLTETRTFSDVTVTVATRGWKCAKCGEGWLVMNEAMAADLAMAKVTMALGSRDPKAFTYCRKVIGIGIPVMAERFSATAAAVALYKEQGVIEPAWWETLAHLVAVATGAEDCEVPLPPLPACRGSYRSEQ